MPILPATPQNLVLAKELLLAGGLVAFPTETVYGLGADATSDVAVAEIFRLKQRPQFNPLIVHVADIKALEPHVVLTPLAVKLAKAFWPGPLTLVLGRKPSSSLSRLVSAGLETVAVRIPNHPVALDLLARVSRPIAAPSANRSNFLSPTLPEHVLGLVDENSSRDLFILEGGECSVGLESTVLDLTESLPVLLRPGGVTPADLERVLGQPVLINDGLHSQSSDESFDSAHKSPGQGLKHYAPRIPLRMNAQEVFCQEALLAFGPKVLSEAAAVLNLSPQGDLSEAAANLFKMLHELDLPCFSGIAVMPIPNVGLGLAINDRLRRARVS